MSLFIANDAAEMIGYDLGAYAADCRQRYEGDEWTTRHFYDSHYGRFMGFLGLFAGPFCGYLT